MLPCLGVDLNPRARQDTKDVTFSLVVSPDGELLQSFVFGKPFLASLRTTSRKNVLPPRSDQRDAEFLSEYIQVPQVVTTQALTSSLTSSIYAVALALDPPPLCGSSGLPSLHLLRGWKSSIFVHKRKEQP